MNVTSRPGILTILFPTRVLAYYTVAGCALLVLLGLIGSRTGFGIEAPAFHIDPEWRSGSFQPLANDAFWLGQGTKIAGIYAITYLAGLLVLRRGVRPNYTRKIYHFALITFTLAAATVFPFTSTPVSLIVDAVIGILIILVWVEPVRRRLVALATMFRAVERPEDRPFTLLWLWTTVAAAYVAFIPVMLVAAAWERSVLIYIPYIISSIGDGLAEPVGVRFGRHPYTTWALFTSRRYTRTLEGSACVFIVGVVTVCLFAGSLSTPEFWAALLILPPLLTVAEAVAPHTWDNPFLLLIGAVGLGSILKLM